MSRIRVVVTVEDIAQGRKNALTCPIREALLGRFDDPAVGVTVWAPSWDADVSYPLSRRAKAFIRAVDSKRPVQPATFYLEGPDR